MRQTAMLFAMIALCATTAARAAQPCPVDGADDLTALLSRAPTCGEASRLLDRCTWGSSMDVQFSQVVIDRCEKDFLPAAPAARRAAYKKERAACDRKYAKMSGSMYVGFAAVCNAHVAAKYSGK